MVSRLVFFAATVVGLILDTMHPSHGPWWLLGYSTGPYSFPTDGKQPVILGPNGTPVYPNIMQGVDKEYEEDDITKKAPPVEHAPSPSYDFHDEP